MNEIDRIIDQITRAFAGEAWHGPALSETLHGLPAQQAAARPLPRAHSIWEIVLHLIATQTVLLRRLNGDFTELTPAEDWPMVDETTETAWQRTLEMLREQELRFRSAVKEFPVKRLDMPLNPGGSSAYNNFQGHAQHMTYHAGQIALLRRAG